MDDTYITAYYNSLVEATSSCRPARRANYVQSLHSTIAHLKDRLGGKGINIARPCTGSSENDCWIFSHLTVWNEILYAINSELREDRVGLLALCSLDGVLLPGYKGRTEACVAVHWLLKEHHCICTVELDDVSLVKDHAFLFCNALSVSKAVKNFVLSLCHFNSEYGAELGAAVGRMTCLDKFKLLLHQRGTYIHDDYIADMGASIGSTNTLTELSLEKTRWPSNAVAFLNGVKTCTNLKVLCVTLTELSDSGARGLSDLLLNNPDLEKIELKGILFTHCELCAIAEKLTATPLLKLQTLQLHHCRLHASALGLLTRALQKHKALISLKIIDCNLDCINLESLVHGLDHCGYLCELCLDCNSIKDLGATALARYLGVAQKLEVLSLKRNMLSSCGVMAIIEASIQKGSDTKLYFGHVEVNEEEAHKISQTLEAEGAHERVQMVYGSTGCFQLGKVLRTNKYKLDQIAFDGDFELTPKHFVELFSSLSCNCTVKHLAVETGAFDGASAQELGCLLLTNKTLKSLELGAILQPSHMIILFENLAKNTSLSKLVLPYSRFDASTTRVFVSMLKMNRTLNEFRTFLGASEPLSILVDGLPDNYTLLELNILPEVYNRKVMFDVGEVRRRNYALLNKAAKFALMKSPERSLALAFEKVCMNDSLTSHLKRINAMSEEAAKMLIRQAARCITDQYTVLSGIVKEKLECCRNSGDAVQIDQLSAECLQKIFSYLRLEDVMWSDGKM
ncbi:uncharacterized protein LOC135399333 [Ornithodoros turicata]|uniref:uncharacterized protein LOC135399333 n=1 Tax=Ornithodoros turicata TaxID=34597 RepID=UPI00313861C0